MKQGSSTLFKLPEVYVEDSGVSASTQYGWFYGTTKRPQFATVNAVARACGKTLVFEDK